MTSLAEDAHAWAAEYKENRWVLSMTRVRTAWDQVLSVIKTRAKEGNEHGLLCASNVKKMRGFGFEDYHELASRLRNHGFYAKITHDQDGVFVEWSEPGKKK